MQTITKDELIEWLKNIGQRIFIIKTSRQLYDEFIENIKLGKFNGLKTEFCWWVRNNYESNIIILLTGLLEGSLRHDDDLNFQKFLRKINDYGLDKLKKELIADKPHYFSDFNNIVLETLDENDFLEKERIKYIEENYFKNIDIENDIRIINENFLKLKDFRDKQIAHFTKNNDTFDLTNSDLDNIISEIINIFEKYALIICNTNYFFD